MARNQSLLAEFAGVVGVYRLLIIRAICFGVVL